MRNNIQFVRVFGDSLCLSTLRGVYLDADGEEVGTLVDCVVFSPGGQTEVILDWLEGESTSDFRPAGD